MRDCPACLGEGHHDLRDMDAWFEEHHTDEELARWERRGFVRKVGVVGCDVCEGTGLVDLDTWKDMMARARAAIDQVVAKVMEEEAQGRG